MFFYPIPNFIYHGVIVTGPADTVGPPESSAVITINPLAVFLPG